MPDPGPDDFGSVLESCSNLAAISLAAYAIIVSLQSFPGLAPALGQVLHIAYVFLVFATIVFLIGAWALIINRGQQLGMVVADFLFFSQYTWMFWGIAILLLGFFFLTTAVPPF